MARRSTERAHLEAGLPVGDRARAALLARPAHAHEGSWQSAGWQVMMFAGPALMYFLVRSLSAGQRADAFANAAKIIDLQKSLGLDWEATLQGQILGTAWLVDLMNWIYIYGHFPLLIGALVVLFWRSRHNFVLLRNALIASGAIGLVCFAFFPVAPPRLFQPGIFFDSLTELSTSYQILQNPSVTNQFAAVPSFHVGWNLLVVIMLIRAMPFRLFKPVIAVLPALMAAAVLLTANHWVLDIVAGVAVALVGLLVGVIVDRMAQSWEPSSGRPDDDETGDVDQWGRWGSNPRQSDYESRALTN